MIRDEPGERLTFHRSDALPGFELMAAYGSLQPWHVIHETYAFGACRTAAAGWRYRRGDHVLEDGTTMLLEPGEVHRNTTVYKRSDFKVLFIEPSLLVEASHELDIRGTPHFDLAQTNNRELIAAVWRLSMAVESDDTVLRQQSLLAETIFRILAHAERKPRPVSSTRAHRAVARARAYLEDHCHEQVMLDELSAVAEISRFHLARAFKAETGLPPHAYQIHVRIARARRLLKAGMLPATVASLLGFSDQSHFARHFKRILRVTPGEYARA